MFTSPRGPRPAARRRGIVLVLVLGMLGLMALIGVTFAAFAGQSLKNSRNYGQGAARPQPEALMDFALAQLINDSNNPLSAIRGHSLLRDMYGNDSVYRGSNPPRNAVVDLLANGVFDRVFNNNVGGFTTLQLSGGQIHPTNDPNGNPTPFYGQLQWTTNIPTSGPYYGLDFTRWTLRIPSGSSTLVGQTFEVLEDDFTTGVHKFTLSANLGAQANTVTSGDGQSFIYANPNLGANTGTNPPFQKSFTALTPEVNGSNSYAFVLDGRYMRAFNGPGRTRPVSAASSVDVNGNVVQQFANYPYNLAAYANMRLAEQIGFAGPDAAGMDEDYDACDLENWFLAIQSADGQVMVPSFHRPGILTASDWTDPAYDASTPPKSINQQTRAKILRPRQIDNSPLFPIDPSVPDSTTGKLTYDVDNDGDGVTDSVWLDLGYPTQRDVNGKLSKPLFAFMVLGLNGRLPLNTVGNLQARAIGDITNNTPTTYRSTGQVPYAGYYTTSGSHNAGYSSQVYFDMPLYDHASHLGFSVNEINPKFALQNAPSNLFTPSNGSNHPEDGSFSSTSTFSQFDNAGVSVALTQLRNLLAGGMATDLPNPYPASAVTAGGSAVGGIATYRSSGSTKPYNNDVNLVLVQGSYNVFPNGMADGFDFDPVNKTLTNVTRTMPAIPGRWGEPEGQPRQLNLPSAYNDADPTYPMLRYQNPVRAGRSYYTSTGYTNDAMDDDFDAFDPYLPTAADNSTNQFAVIKDTTTYDNSLGHQYELPVGSSNTGFPVNFKRKYPEDVDRFDGAGQAAVAAERIRRFVTPQDPAGVGRMVAFMNRPAGDFDFGKGADKLGRIGYFRYFRPAGMPQAIVYPYDDTAKRGFNNNYATTLSTNNPSGLGQRYLAPVLIPAGRTKGMTGTPTPVPLAITPDVTNNVLHGYQAMATPDTQGGQPGDPSAHLVATMGAMPFDYVASTADDGTLGTTPAGYPNTLALYAPTINPQNTNLIQINSTTGPNLGAVGAGGNDNDGYPYQIPYVPGYTVADYPTNSYSGDVPNSSMVVNGYIGGSLNKDEADEMNLYAANVHDAPYGPTDLEWLYRKHDVDGSTLDSRLGQLAPISFLNSADGLTRRRLFSVDAWDLNTFAYANDNPVPYAGVLGYDASQTNHPYSGIHTPDHDFSYNSRFGTDASPSLENMNQVVVTSTTTTSTTYSPNFANHFTTEFLFNPTLPIHTYSTATGGNGDSFLSFVPNSKHILGASAGPVTPSPRHINTASKGTAVADPYNGLINPSDPNFSTMQVQTPTVAHRDRRINLNYPLPISADPAEPIRQKWCRETYQLLKSILPPAAVDTPEELAQLSQFVVNIVDFRDPDATMTRFVNTDLVITDALTKTAPLQSPTPGAPTLIPPAGGWTTSSTYPPVMDVSPMGVRFASGADRIPTNHFPYDASIYSPDAVTPFLVQHGMEFNPIAINEAFAVQYKYPTAKGDTTLGGTCRAMFLELVNTLTESQNESNDGTGRPTRTNSSAIDLTGWDLIITPDEFGWGRPDPISGDVSVVAWPPLPPTTTLANPVTDGQKSANGALTNATSTPVMQYRFTSVAASTSTTPRANNVVEAINGSALGDFGIVGAYTTSGTAVTTGAGQTTPPALTGATSGYVETNPVALGTTLGGTSNPTWSGSAATTPPKIDVVLPQSMIPYSSTVSAGGGAGTYFWVYLRRPANPFDTDDLSLSAGNTRINREMVVVDAMRFPYMDLYTSRVTFSGSTSDNTDRVNAQAPDTPYSAQRLQPYRGGHLLRKDTTTLATTKPTVNGATVNTICPPTPPYAYGYSEQTSPSNDDTDYLEYVTNAGTPDPNKKISEHSLRETIGANNGGTNKVIDTNWAHFPFHDRDFASVAELLLVPGCPPGLFTKQFVEEPYPGHAAGYSVSNAAVPPPPDPLPVGYTPPTPGPATVGTAAAALGSDMSDLTGVTAVPSGVKVGRKDFGFNTPPAVPTFPYLTDNFYYTAASVAPPGTPNAGQTLLTTEIGGWTGAGWHKMLEFFEVPSSANGAIGTADVGNNYDWYRADLRPGQLNLNLIVDEEVFAGLIDDPRINETLAYPGSSIPQVVTQIDAFGHPTSMSSLFLSQSYNIVNNAGQTSTFGRGYAVRDPDSTDYPAGGPYNYQQVHGLKAAFSDFLKLRHGGSGFLFAHGGGDVSMGNYGTTRAKEPVAADRPFRSLTFPDINYTILRPASLPPAPANTGAANPYDGTTPPLPAAFTPTSGVTPLFQYLATTTAPYVTLNPTSYPFAAATPYIGDPGLRNPYLDTAFNTGTTAPPYDVSAYNVTGGYTANVTTTTPPAPFPPTIPPTPARRLFQVPDTQNLNFPTSNAGLYGQQDNAYNTDPTLNGHYMVNEPVNTLTLSSGNNYPPTLFPSNRAVFAADNITPQAGTIANNYLGAGATGAATSNNDDLRQHPAYRTELLQKMMNLTTVRTHQFAVWITVGFFEVIKTGTPELGIPDVLGQEVGAAAGDQVRFRSFFVVDRTKATGFNPYYPGNFRDCVTYRRRIE